jgi:hypothetical protein
MFEASLGKVNQTLSQKQGKIKVLGHSSSGRPWIQSLVQKKKERKEIQKT